MTLKGTSIVVVDDESMLLEIFTRWLEREGCHVLSAGNGAEALPLVEAHRPRAVVTDVRMPVMGGRELTQRIMASGGPVPKIAFISGFSDLGERECFDLGVEACLPKPVDRSALIDALRRCLTDRDALWRAGPADPPAHTLTAGFEGLAAARRDGLLALGRGGFCIRAKVAADVDEMIGIALSFAHEQRCVTGRGVLRWVDSKEGLAGVEIMQVQDADRAWVVDLAAQVPVSGPFIPRQCHAGSLPP